MNRGTLRGIGAEDLAPPWMGGGDPANDGFMLQLAASAEGGASVSPTPFVIVSPYGTAQGLRPNNGARFGPDTPGTTTCGIQEALNSLPAITTLDGAGNSIPGKRGWVHQLDGVARGSSVVSVPAGVITWTGAGTSTYVPPESGITAYADIGGSVYVSTDLNGAIKVPNSSFSQPQTTLHMRGIEFREVSPGSAQSSSTAPVGNFDGVIQGDIIDVSCLEVATGGGLGGNLYEMFRMQKSGNSDRVTLQNIKGLGGSIGIRVSGPHVTMINAIGGMVSNNVVSYASCFQLGFEVHQFFASLQAYSGKYGLLWSTTGFDVNEPAVIHGIMLEAVTHYMLNDASGTAGTLLLENAGWSSGVDPTTDIPATMPAGFNVMSTLERDDTGLYSPRRRLHVGLPPDVSIPCMQWMGVAT